MCSRSAILLLLTLCCLLALATPASAEWVLWQTLTIPDRGTMNTLPSLTFDTKYDCESWIWLETGSAGVKEIPSRPRSLLSYQCLPDTVDPRRPKGK